jgi:general secretion pathway protein G
MRRSFTLIEIIIVIIVLAILVGIAIPKFTNSIDAVDIIKTKSDIIMIKSEILEYKNNQLLKTNIATYPSNLDDILSKLNILSSWEKNNNIYTIKLTSTKSVKFKYDSSVGHFDCNYTTQDECLKLTR